MTRFHFSLGFLHSSPLPHRASVDMEHDEIEGEGESECVDDLYYSPLVSPAAADGVGEARVGRSYHFSVLATMVAALRKSLGKCSLGASEDGRGVSIHIGRPTDVQHVAHVTFDRVDGFLGVPSEFLPDIPSKVPSASSSVFGVSAKSMQCSYDSRGNSVPTILLSMQICLYSQGGLQAEGIFRINAENGQELMVREQLNKGFVPHGVDPHCLASLIKAWFRELPSGVLDSLTPEMVMHCNTEEECSQLVRMLPSAEAGLLDWAINLMADVVEYESYNKMNARNIAMVFAPNMTKMADPLTALIHAVQVMNFLKTLTIKALRGRDDAATKDEQSLSQTESLGDDGCPHLSRIDANCLTYANGEGISFAATEVICKEDDSASDADESFWSFDRRSEVGDGEFFSVMCSPTISDLDSKEDESKGRHGSCEAEGLFNRINLRKGVQKLCSNTAFHLSRLSKETGEADIVGSRSKGLGI
ncbi:hypothetical protein HPP92_015076 [Vanilla planifolia]|uniref:Uncharacterized protein n=1 Tax=Vanilla planifolia TaxID=51239 RepID=A0A835QNU1_VANPL|nr:hypothetical protein HPP92_015076 [Vanilla planifolia]